MKPTEAFAMLITEIFVLEDIDIPTCVRAYFSGRSGYIRKLAVISHDLPMYQI